MVAQKRLFVFPLIFFVVLVWAGNFISISFLLKEIDIFTALTCRLGFVAALLYPFLKKLPYRKDYYVLFLASLAIVPGHLGLLFLALQSTKSVGGVSVLVQLCIPFSMVLAWIFFDDYPGRLRLLGLAVSFFGIILLLYEPTLLESRKSFLLAIGSAFCMGIYFVIVKKLQNVNSIGVVAWTSLFGVPMMYVFMLLNDNSFGQLLHIQNGSTIVSFFYTIVIASILGHGVWAYLVKTQDISFISPFLLLIPLFSVIFSIIFLDEKITFNFMIASSIIIFGILLVFISKKKDQR